MIFRLRRMKYPIREWTGIAKGDVGFVMGNGPSLIDNRLSLLDDFFTIGINRVFKVFAPTILFWQDREISRSHHQEIERCPSVKVCRDTSDTSSRYTNFILEQDPFSFHPTPWRLYGRGCSAALAVQLAVSMGCRAIVLLGCDCAYLDGKTDFYGNNRFHRPHALTLFHNAMKWIHQECPVPVYNCGAAPYWPRIALEEAVSLTEPRRQSKLKRLAVLKEGNGEAVS